MFGTPGKIYNIICEPSLIFTISHHSTLYQLIFISHIHARIGMTSISVNIGVIANVMQVLDH